MKRIFNRLGIIIALLAGFILIGPKAMSQVPDTPYLLPVLTENYKPFATVTFRVNSKAYFNAQPDLNLYLAKGEIHDPDNAEFSLIKTYKYGFDSSMVNNDTVDCVFYMTYNEYPQGTYSVYFTAEKNGNTSKPSNIEKFTIGVQNDFTINFLNLPPNPIGKIGTYETDFRAGYSTDGGITYQSDDMVYSLNKGPEGMTIDQNGLVKWAPENPGLYSANVKVGKNYMGQTKELAYTWSFEVFQCDSAGTLNMYVKMAKDSIELSDLSVDIYKMENGEPQYRKSAVVMDGFLKVLLDEGTYYLYFDGVRIGYKGSWYDNAQNIDEATPVEIGCAQSKTITAFLKDLPDTNLKKQVVFTSTPATHTKIDADYKYDVDAKIVPGGGEIRYLLTNAPAGMTINYQTGLINWKPDLVGTFEVIVKAVSIEDTLVSNTQKFSIRVTSCDILATLLASVDYEDGSPVKLGMAEIYTKENNEKTLVDKVRLSDGKLIYYGLDEGTYYVYLDGLGQSFENEWYKDSPDFEGALPIEVNCGDSTVFSVKVRKTQELNNYTVSGVVIRKSTDKPIKFAVVEFYGRLDDFSPVKVWKTTTNTDGRYEIKLPESYQYVAYAYSMDTTQTDLLPLYWDDAQDAAMAKEFLLTQDMPNVNFALYDRPEYNNSIYGTVLDENNTVISEAYVIAYLVNAGPFDQDKLYVGRTARTNINGQYEIKNLIPGKYVVFAYPNDSHYVPGYYKENDFAVKVWLNATLINVEFSGTEGPFDPKLLLRDAINGNGEIGGMVGAGDGGVVKADKNNPLGLEPVHGAVVYAYGKGGTLRGYSFTDENGNYTIYGLDKGEYLVIADRIGYKSGENTVKLENDDSKGYTDLTLIKEPLGVDDDNGSLIPSVRVYPNPATDYIMINPKGLQGKTEYILTDNVGRELRKLNSNENGVNEMRVSLKSLPSGVYFIKIVNGTNTYITSFTITR